MSLSNKVILVSGANRGIGAATVRELLKAGVAKIYAGARNVNSLPDFNDPRVVPLQLDVTSDASVNAAVAVASDIDVLLNNAGLMSFGDPLSIAPEALDIDMQTNYYGTLRVLRAFTPGFVSRGSGTIVNMVSVVGLAAVPLIAGYSASKAALQSLTQSLRGALAPSGITVLGIYPGPVDTDLSANIPLEKASPETVAEKIVRGIEDSQTYIFPDPMAEQVGHLWANDGRQLEIALQVGG